MNHLSELLKLLNPVKSFQGTIHKVEGNTYLVSTKAGSLTCTNGTSTVLKVGDFVLIRDLIIIGKSNRDANPIRVTV